ncbi:hypothetical protein YC2023_045951 [Brassica napus]
MEIEKIEWWKKRELMSTSDQDLASDSYVRFFACSFTTDPWLVVSVASKFHSVSMSVYRKKWKVRVFERKGVSINFVTCDDEMRGFGKTLVFDETLTSIIFVMDFGLTSHKSPAKAPIFNRSTSRTNLLKPLETATARIHKLPQPQPQPLRLNQSGPNKSYIRRYKLLLECPHRHKKSSNQRIRSCHRRNQFEMVPSLVVFCTALIIRRLKKLKHGDDFSIHGENMTIRHSLHTIN